MLCGKLMREGGMERKKGKKGSGRDKGREHEGEWEGEGGRRGEIYISMVYKLPL